MPTYPDPTYADLHIHIGRTETGKPVKITGSTNLTLHHILEEAVQRKGLGLIGIIDCHVPEVLAELQQLIREGKAKPLQGGGVSYGELTLLLGTEMEVYDESCQGPIHVLCFLPTLEYMTAFSHWMSGYQKNITLSSQRSYVEVKQLQHKVRELEGLFIPAHIFTPFKSTYGKGVRASLTEVFIPELIDAVELGLSSDTSMADTIAELHSFPYLSNSDAHSLRKIGREYQVFALAERDFVHVQAALQHQKGQSILANYGLDPKLGKYHKEVSKRISELSRVADPAPTTHPPIRPPYIHHIPLEYIPSLGPKALDKLIQHFGSEMNVIHKASLRELEQWVKPEVAAMIVQARSGDLQIEVGGAGKYGRVSYSTSSTNTMK